MSQSEDEEEENDVPESDPSTRDSLYPSDPPKRRHKKQKKNKKCKTMRRICFRIPKLIFLTGIGLIVVFSMKRLSEIKDVESNSTMSPSDVTLPAGVHDSRGNDQPVMADGTHEEDEEDYGGDEDDSELERYAEEKNKSEDKVDGKKGGLIPVDIDDDEEDDLTGKHLQYRMKRAADGSVAKGKEFKFQRQKKGVAEIVAQEVEPDDEATAGHAVLVTGVYDAIFSDVEQLIASVQKYLPSTPIVVFEINLSADLKEKLLTMCNVEVRPFWIDIFPAHLKDFSNRSWRPFVMQIALAEFHFIVWMDPQTRLRNSRIEPALRLATSSGVAVVSSASRLSPLSLTHPEMLQFLPTDEGKLTALPHMHVTMLVLHNSDELQDNFMKWLLLCASEKECLSPEGSSPDCDSIRVARNRDDRVCHRYDESAVNILLGNWFQYDMRRFYIKDSITEPTSEKTGQVLNVQICNRKGHKRDL